MLSIYAPFKIFGAEQKRLKFFATCIVMNFRINIMMIKPAYAASLLLMVFSSKTFKIFRTHAIYPPLLNHNNQNGIARR